MATLKEFRKRQKVFTSRTTLVLTVFICLSMAASAQTVNDVPIKDIQSEYVEIVGRSKLFSTKVTVEIDFGQQIKAFGGAKQVRIRDADGNNMEFNSMIDALDFMSENGYTFVQAFAFATNNENIYHYLMKKTKGKDQENKDKGH